MNVYECDGTDTSLGQRFNETKMNRTFHLSPDDDEKRSVDYRFWDG